MSSRVIESRPQPTPATTSLKTSQNPLQSNQLSSHKVSLSSVSTPFLPQTTPAITSLKTSQTPLQSSQLSICTSVMYTSCQTDSTSSIFVAATNSTSNLLCNCESSNGWKIAAALGWTLSAILLCVCITLVWFHYCKNKHKAAIPQLNRTSREKFETVVTRNPVYSAVAMWQDRSMETTEDYEVVEPC
ncbi:uncharacterized protein LOC134189244 [Corticium candelabrum]|uniref:uncharacterized protein LOC134189244 n=1 Tax=Corticium candelabrum TaxID=121492 RepID=UPI002E25D2E3|nr:uncharacterized protein LOC134189244 [Corticium candelabrum]